MTTETRTLPKLSPPPSGHNLYHARRVAGRVGLYAALIGIGLILFTPFILALLGTFKTDAEITAWPPKIFPAVWQVENWPRLFATDLGGLPRPEGASSLGLMTGMFAYLAVFLFAGSSTSESGRGMSRSAALPLCILLAFAGGAASGLFLQALYQADLIQRITVGASIVIFSLIVLALLNLSNPHWDRVLAGMAGGLVVGAVVTLIFMQLAVLSGGGRFFRWFYNTALLSVLRAFIMLLFCSMAAYAFARMRFPGRDAIFNFMLATMMIPGAVLLVPNYVVIAKLKWINTAYSLILPVIVNQFGIFLLTQFLKAIPRELEEAAIMDGASHFQIYKDVILPLARPALLTLFILQFQGMWNDFLTPLLYLNTPDMWVLNVALTVFQQNYKAQWNLTLVGAMINAVVPLTLFFFFSKHYIEGVSYTGLK